MQRTALKTCKKILLLKTFLGKLFTRHSSNLLCDCSAAEFGYDTFDMFLVLNLFTTSAFHFFFCIVNMNRGEKAILEWHLRERQRQREHWNSASVLDEDQKRAQWSFEIAWNDEDWADSIDRRRERERWKYIPYVPVIGRCAWSFALFSIFFFLHILYMYVRTTVSIS
jgi:hypothetical protein